MKEVACGKCLYKYVDGDPHACPPLRERVEKFFREVCEYDNEPFIRAIESFAREIRNEALEEAARIVINRGCAHQDSGKANVLIEAGNAIHTLTLAAKED